MRRLLTIIILLGPLLIIGQNKVFVIPDSLNQSMKVQGIDLFPYLEFIEVTDEDVRIDDAVDSKSFSSIDQMEYDRKKFYWFKITLSTSHGMSDNYYLRFDPDLYVELYDWDSKSNTYQKKLTGPYLRPSQKEVIFDRKSFIKVQAETGFEIFYFKLGQGQLIETPMLYSSVGLNKLIEWRKTKNTVFMTIAICMILYNLLIYFFVKDRSFIYYLFFVLGVGLFSSSIHYYAYWFSTFHMHNLMLITMNLAFFSFIKFLALFLRLKELSKRHYRIALAFGLGSILLSVPFLVEIIFGVPLEVIPIVEKGSQLWGLLMILYGYLVSNYSWKRGFKEALYFLVASVIFLFTAFVGLGIEFLGDIQAIDYDEFYTREIVFGLGGLGLSSQVILYGLAIGYRIIRLEKDKSKAVQEKLEAKESINLQLEEKVIERTAQLEHRNKENELLLGEIHHRVKNNLQVISSLLKLQSRQLEEGKAKSAVLEGRDRVKAMALIHQRLYQQDQFSAIQMDDYIGKLVESLAESYGFGEKEFELELNIPTVQLDVDTAVPLGLIINELVSNSFKHAFRKGRNNRLSISLEEGEDTLNLVVEDDGEGIPSYFKVNNSSSFGLQLINALTKELDGQFQFENHHGTRVRISIKDYKIVSSIEA